MSLGVRIAVIMGAISACLMLLLLFAADSRPIEQLGKTDYVAAFYVAGDMVMHGQGANLYPALDAETVRGSTFENYGNELIAHLLGQSHHTGPSGFMLFMYPPVLALVFAPLSALPVGQSLVAWQCISLCALVLSVMLLCRTPGPHPKFYVVLSTAFLFLPILHTLIIGQTSLILGLLPLTAGYYFWQRRSWIPAGLCWSVLGLKPQLAFAPFIIVCAIFLLAGLRRDRSALREACSVVVGGVVGTCVLHGVAALVTGLPTFLGWLHAMRIVGEAFITQTGDTEYHLFFSMPAVALVLLPPSLWREMGVWLYALGGLLIGGGVWLAFKTLALSPFDSDRSPTYGRAMYLRDMAVVISVPIAMFCAPHLLVYDVVILLLPGWILLFRIVPHLQAEASENKTAIRLAIASALMALLSLDAYVFALIALPHKPGGLVQLLLLLELALFTVLLFCWLNPLAPND